MKKLLQLFSLVALLAHLASAARASVHEYHNDPSTFRVLTISWETTETNDWGTQVIGGGFFDIWLYSGDSYDQDDEVGYDPPTGTVWGTTYFVMFDEYQPDPSYETWESFDDPYVWSYGTWSPSPAGTWEDQLCNQSRTNSRWHSIGERSNLGNTRYEGGYTEYETEHQTVAGTKPLNWRTFDEVTWDWHEVGSWNPDPGVEWEDRLLTQFRPIVRTHRTGRRNDRGDEDSIGGYNEEGTTSRVVSGSRPLNWRFWENRLTRDWYDAGNWGPSPAASYFWEYVGQSIPRLQDWSEWAIDDRGDSRLSRVFTVGGTFYRTVTGTQVPALSAVQVGLPGGAGAVNVGVGSAGGTVALPNGISVTGNSNGAGSVSLPNTVVPGGASVSMNGGQVTVTTPGGVAAVGPGGSIDLGGGVVVSVTPSGNASVALPGGMSISIGPGGGSIGFPGGTVVRVAGDGRIDVELPPGAPPLLAKAVNLAGTIYGAGAGHIISVRDAVTLLVGPLPSNLLLDSLDLGITAGGVTQVGLRQNNDGATTWLPIFVRQVMPAMALAVDANRDGVIKLPSEDATDATSSTSPFRFWINDDNDSGDTGGTDIPRETGHGDGDGQSPRINGRRDLVDFFPVFLDLKQFLTVLPTSSGIRYKLKHADSALRFVYSNLVRDTAFDYQRPPLGSTLPVSGYGSLDAINPFSLPPENAFALPITAGGVSLNAVFLNYILTNNGGVILIEGVAPTTKPLVLSVEKSDGTVLAEVKLELNIAPVETMFRHLNLHDRNLAGLVGAMPGGTAQPNAMGDPTGFPDYPNNDSRWLIFVHGFNVSGQSARGWNAEMFKRCYWSGNRSRFVGVSWFGNPDQVLGAISDYHLAVRNAMVTASVLAQEINALPGSADTKTVFAHSLGCGVASSAIADYGMNVGRVCFVDAALALECFDGRSPGTFDSENDGMTPATWKVYDPKLYAANWFNLFDPATDARGKLTWNNRFTRKDGGQKDASPFVYHFYSSTEDVLAEYKGELPATLGGLLWAPGHIGTFGWVYQEKGKGNRQNYLFQVTAEGVTDLTHLGSHYGGWGMNLKDPFLSADVGYWKWVQSETYAAREMKTPVEIGSVSEFILRRHPAFEPGWGKVRYQKQESPVSDVAPVTGAPSWIFDLYLPAGQDRAADPQNRAQLLAEAIPSLTWCMGSHESKGIDKDKNFNLPKLVDQLNWPRGKPDNVTPEWRHSDMREVAYLYQYGVFDKIIAISKL